MRRLPLLLALAAVGCNGPALTTGPATPPPAAPALPSAASPPARDPLAAPVPVVGVVVGRPDTLLVADLLGEGVAVAVPPSDGPAWALLLGADRLVIEAAEAGLHVISITVDGARVALAVEAARTAAPVEPRLAVRVVGTEPDDPSQLRLEVREVDARGRESLPVGLDDDDGVVALDGNRPLDDNAVYFDPDVGELALDLDALGPGRRRLRLAVRDGARVSRWVEVWVEDGRLSETDTGSR